MARQLINVNRGPGMTFDEIAASMGERTGTIRIVYLRAMRKLKSQPEALQMLQGLADELDRERSRQFGNRVVIEG